MMLSLRPPLSTVPGCRDVRHESAVLDSPECRELRYAALCPHAARLCTIDTRDLELGASNVSGADNNSDFI